MIIREEIAGKNIMKIIEKKTRGLALLVTTAATLGTIQVPLYAQAQDVVSAAEAATNTSDGIRAHGAIKKADQKDSTLRPGEYEVFAYSEDVGKNMPGGWHVNMSRFADNPSFNKPNWDKPFGVQISFNNSQDRTVRYWEMSDSGRGILIKKNINHTEGDDKPVYEHIKIDSPLTDVLFQLNVHSLNPGVTFFTDEGLKKCSSDCPPITHKADELMYLQRRKHHAMFAIGSKMSAQDVLDMSKSDWMTYGWAWEYESEARPYVDRMFGTDDSFAASVSFNPWPSENNDFTQIKTTWEDIKNLVIEPGKEIKIGHINADADSIPRMLVEGYNEQDTFIGTSSTDFSQGGKKNIRIDNNGDIFWTPDSYIDNDLSNQKSIKFTAYAMPRSVEQLKSAFLQGYSENFNDNLEFTGPTNLTTPDENAYVGEESNVLPRYKYANEIDSHTVNFDDEMYHNPGYDNTRKNIISGVNQQGVFTGKEQNVTFNPKDFGNILQSKAQGGNDATIKLDTTDVFPGWKATLNKDNTVTVTAPGDALPGTFAQPQVVVTYTNGSQDIIPLMVSVRPNDTQVTNFTAGEGVSGIPGEEMSIHTSVSPQYESQPAKTPVSYEIKSGTYPQDTWDVSVDNNGVVKATPHVDVPNGTTISPVVIAHYADKTTDEAKAVFTANMQVNTPQYKSVSGTVNNTVSILPEVPQEEGKVSPSKFTFPGGKTTYKQGTWNVTINPDTGEITTMIPQGAQPGSFMNIPVEVHYPNTNWTQTVNGTFVVESSDSDINKSQYPPATTLAGNKIDIDFVTGLPDKTQATYKLPDNIPDGWKLEVAPDGTLSVTPPKDAKPGTSEVFDITVTYPDGSQGVVPASVSVQAYQKDVNNPFYNTVSGKPGEKIESPVNTSEMSPDVSVTYTLKKPKDAKDVAPGIPWDNIKVDKKTGVVSVDIPQGIAPGTYFDVPVEAKYKDKSTDTVLAPFVVAAQYSHTVNPSYLQKKTTSGVPVESPVVGISNKNVLSENPFVVPAEKDGWKFTVNNDGVIIATPPAGARDGDGVSVPVTVNFADGSSTIVEAPFVVQDAPTRAVKFETNITYDDKIPAGEAKITTPGVLGEETQQSDGSWVLTKKPVNEVVVVGTKPVVSSEKRTVDIPFNTIYQANNKLAPGETKVIRDGKNGEHEFSVVFNSGADNPVVVNDKVIRKPVDKIIEYGTSVNADPSVSTVERRIPFEVKFVEDPDLEAGKQEVETPGKHGVDKVTITTPVINGKPGTPVETVEHVFDPVTQVIRVGTKPKEITHITTETETTEKTVPTTITTDKTVEKTVTSDRDVPTTITTEKVIPTTVVETSTVEKEPTTTIVEKTVKTTVTEEKIVPTTITTKDDSGKDTTQTTSTKVTSKKPMEETTKSTSVKPGDTSTNVTTKDTSTTVPDTIVTSAPSSKEPTPLPDEDNKEPSPTNKPHVSSSTHAPSPGGNNKGNNKGTPHAPVFPEFPGFPDWNSNNPWDDKPTDYNTLATIRIGQNNKGTTAGVINLIPAAPHNAGSGVQNIISDNGTTIIQDTGAKASGTTVNTGGAANTILARLFDIFR